jgi:hypothetical protein
VTLAFFPFACFSGEVQRAGFARGSSRAPSTPGGLGAVHWQERDMCGMLLMSCFGDLERVQFAFFLVACFRWGTARG